MSVEEIRGDALYGTCNICGKKGFLTRIYFYYGFKCECHSSEHFEIVDHCKNCVPRRPSQIKVIFSDKQAEYIKKAIKYCEND